MGADVMDELPAEVGIIQVPKLGVNRLPKLGVIWVPKLA